jgi:hypothetical protein
MSGVKEFNYPAFESAASVLRDWGYKVTSPVEIDHMKGVEGILDADAGKISEFGWSDCLARDIERIVDGDIDGVVVLDGWEKSKGASLEVHVAQQLGKVVLRYPELTKVTPGAGESILNEAERLVSGDRGDDYGHPRDDFAKTAGAWQALFGWECTPAQVALAMIVVKLSRLQVTPQKRDSIVDIAGYARTYEMVLEREGTPARKYSETVPSLVDVQKAWDRVNNEKRGWSKLTADVKDTIADNGWEPKLPW